MVIAVRQPSDVYVETIDDADGASVARLVGPDGSEIELSGATYALFQRVLQQLRQGRGVRVVVYDRDLTTQQAADILNVSRQYLVQLLERGAIPFHKVGTHRRVRLVDVLAYHGKRRHARRDSLRRLTQASQKMGGYDDNPT